MMQLFRKKFLEKVIVGKSLFLTLKVMENNRKQWRKVNGQNEQLILYIVIFLAKLNRTSQSPSLVKISAQLDFSLKRYSRKRKQKKSYLNNRKTR